MVFFKQKTAYARRIRYWGSDVCSSDLPCLLFDHRHVSRSLLVVPHAGSIGVAPTLPLPIPHSSPSGLTRGSRAGDEAVALDARVQPEIGRASCRESVCRYVLISVVAVSFKKKNYLLVSNFTIYI